MWEVAAFCVTAILVAIIIAGGINRAAFYLSAAILAYMKDRDKHRDNDQV